MPASWSSWYDALPPVVLCGIVVAILHVSHRQAMGSPWVYPWIFPWICTKKIGGYGYGYGWAISYPRQPSKPRTARGLHPRLILYSFMQKIHPMVFDACRASPRTAIFPAWMSEIVICCSSAPCLLLPLPQTNIMMLLSSHNVYRL